MKFTFTKPEQVDLIKAWALLSLAFAIHMSWPAFNLTFLLNIAFAALTLGLGFLLHELAHKWVAMQYDCYAQFRAYMKSLFISLLLSPFILFAAPGAVHISGHASREQRGWIALAGPAMNIALALLFMAAFEMYPLRLFSFGAVINAWLALFNMLPFPPFDGAKVLAWNKVAFGVTLAIAIILSMLMIPLGIW